MPASKFLVLALCVALYHIPLICMVTFYTKLIIHINDSSMYQIDDNNMNNCNFGSYNQSFSRTNQRQASPSNLKIFQSFKSKRKNIDQQIENNFIFNYSNNNTELLKKNIYQSPENENLKTTALVAEIKRAGNNENGYCFCSSAAFSEPYRSEKISFLSMTSKFALVMPCCFKKTHRNQTRKSNSSLTIKALNKNPNFRNNFIIQCLPDNSSTISSQTMKNIGKIQQNAYNQKNLNGKTKNSLLHKNMETKHDGKSQRKNSSNHNSKIDMDEMIENNDSLVQQRNFGSDIAEMSQSSRFKRFKSMNSMPYIDGMSNNNNQNFTCNNMNNNYEANNELDFGPEVILTLPENNSVEKNNRATSTNNVKKKESLFEYNGYQNIRQKRNRKAARMLGLLVAAFSVCWLPYTIFYPLCQFYPDLIPAYGTIIIWWMGYLNSTINPFLYVYSNKNIR